MSELNRIVNPRSRISRCAARPPRFAWLGLWLLGLGWMLAGQGAHAAILLVLSGEGGVYSEIARQLEQGPGKADYRVTVVSEQAELATDPAGAQAIITIGTRAAEAVYRVQPEVPVLSALITRSGFDHLTTRYYSSPSAAVARGVSVICLDQPLARLYRLGTLLMPEARRVGVLTSELPSLDAVKAFTPDQDSGVILEYVTIDSGSSPISTLSPVMRNSDFVIALPGKKSITVAAARWILKLGSHTRTPVIAYSRKYARSGAVAAIYTSPSDVATQVQQVVSAADGLRSGKARILSPAEFSVEINATVAGVLGVPVQAAEYYRDRIRQWETRP